MYKLDMHTVQNIFIQENKRKKISSKDVLTCEMKWRANICTCIKSIMIMLYLIKFSPQNTLINFSDLLQVELEKICTFFQQFREIKTICELWDKVYNQKQNNF